MRTSVLPADFFLKNRQRLSERLSADSLALMQSSANTIRNADALNLWRQDSDFFYFTGIDYPDCSLLLVPGVEGKTDEYLFIPPVDPELEKWNGKMLTKDQAKETSGVKNVLYNDSLANTLFRNQKWKEVLYCELNDHFPSQSLTPQHLFLADLRNRLPGLQQKKLNLLTSSMRTVKQPQEIEVIRQATSIVKSALEAVMRKLKPGLMEFQIEAELTYQYIYNGCKRHGFDPIVASGKNATVLHYITNNDQLKDGDLVLIDTGGEFQMYSADITRVFPISGSFSERQKECYQAVLDVNKTFIDQLKPGSSWAQLHKLAGELTGDIYSKYGFVEDPKKHLEVSYHRIGHHLGLDIHDVGNPDEPLEPGAVLTVEPGLYLPDEGIGVRIEDNILLTESGCEVLSADIPKEIDDIEAIMSN
ncbi:MAG: aminopeptidase P family protein [Proteobacteria bacterium]|nr:aminopeptidase P family protein [Pseudomonadota bacterium]